MKHLFLLLSILPALHAQCCIGSGSVSPVNTTEAACKAANIDPRRPMGWAYHQEPCAQGSSCGAIKCVISGAVNEIYYSQYCMTPVIMKGLIDSYIATAYATVPQGATVTCSSAMRWIPTIWLMAIYSFGFFLVNL